MQNSEIIERYQAVVDVGSVDRRRAYLGWIGQRGKTGASAGIDQVSDASTYDGGAGDRQAIASVVSVLPRDDGNQCIDRNSPSSSAVRTLRRRWGERIHLELPHGS